MVYNPLNIEREDIVEAHIRFPMESPQTVRVPVPMEQEVPAQFYGENNGAARVLFLAHVPSVGYAVFDVVPSDAKFSIGAEVSESSLENARYRVELDQNGDVARIFDKKINRELLSAPVRLAISTDNPEHWPAWNMDFEDEQRPPKAYVSGPAKISVVENGPARVAVQVEHDAEGSNFVQTIRLSAGDAGNRVEFADRIHWKTKGANLKAIFPLSANNKMATYNWDVGTIQRPNEEERQFEVASHQWIDLTDQSAVMAQQSLPIVRTPRTSPTTTLYA